MAAGYPHPGRRSTAGSVTPVPAIDTHAGGRPADQLREWAAERAPKLGIPIEALEAYAYAARVAEVENPKCHLAWTTLAGIGMVESHHGTYRGSAIAPNGDVTPADSRRAADGTGGNPRSSTANRHRRRRGLRPGDGPDAVHSRNLAALWCRRQQRRRDQPRQFR